MSDGKQDTPPPKRAKKGIVLIALATLVLLGGGGGAAWYLMKPAGDQSASHERHDERRKRIFANLDPFTVNLADEGNERFTQISMVLEVSDAKVAADLGATMPAVRNRVLMLLSSKKSKDILTAEGKQLLAEEIAAAVGGELGWAGETPARPRKVSSKRTDAADEDAEDDETPRRRKSRRDGPPNPIEAVHFVQFIVQ